MTPTTTAASLPEGRTGRLRAYNVGMGALHAIQAFVVLALANDFTLPVVGTFMAGPPGSGSPEVTHIADVSIAWGVAVFLFLSAAAHFIIAAPGVYGWYEKNLLLKRNYARWIEYSLSSSLMVVLIAMLVGIADIAALLAIGGVNASMILFGLLQEKYENPDRPVSWTAYWFGVLAGAIPWIAIAVYLVGPGVANSPPGFVYGIFVSLFVFFNVFAIVMVLQYRKVGPWADYRFGEGTYVLLSLLAKSALAWQVFGGTLAV
ncbi:MAG TPA: heliorhodopsin HeR [Acidimicrobiia bacterium]|nr:heliorhodopsin HeR [Acidimicrobiia bacterium]